MEEAKVVSRESASGRKKAAAYINCVQNKCQDNFEVKASPREDCFL